MTELEDQVRRAMRAHETDAPTATEFTAGRLPTALRPARSRSGRRWLTAVAAAGCVLAVIAGVVAIGRSGRHHVATTAGATPTPPATAVLTCPGKYDAAPGTYWVPQQPSGVDGSARLVPVEAPDHVVVCSYPASAQGGLSQSRQLTRDLEVVPATFTWLPRTNGLSRGCTDELRSYDSDSYLMGLSYPGGTMWLSIPGNHCSGATNGPFETDSNLGQYARAALTTGSWTLPGRQSDNGCPVAPGRLGQETAMVPAGAISVQVCHLPRTGTDTSVGPVITGERMTVLAATLDAQPSTPWDGSIPVPSGTPLPDQYKIIFTYPTGPPVQVLVFSTTSPGLANGSLAAPSAAEILPLLPGLLG